MFGTLSGHVIVPKKSVSKQKSKSVTVAKDYIAKGVGSPSSVESSDSDVVECLVGEAGKLDIQQMILDELLKVNTRLDIIESKMAEGRTSSKSKKKKKQKYIFKL